MGLYLNPNAEAFLSNTRAKIYVDKSLILEQINSIADSSDDFVCLSRPRRFGKSMIGNLISAYYSKGCDTREVFSKMKIGQTPEWDARLNKYNVIKLDLNEWYQNAKTEKKIDSLIEDINRKLLNEFREQFSQVLFEDGSSISSCIKEVYAKLDEKFVIIIDEYDVLIREQVPQRLFDDYLSFLSNLFKGTTIRPAIALAYITGIMPIVRDKVQSKLNEFIEYSMIRPSQFATLIGFTGDEVSKLCEEYGMDKKECARWYDGYKLADGIGMYNPLSVVMSMLNHECESYWSYTGTFETLKDYILADYDGIKEDVLKMIAGGSVPVNVTKFQNTLQSITNKDNAFTYLIHLGYLAYNRKEKTCYIPNEEVRLEWVNAIDDEDQYSEVMKMIKESEELLDATINGDEAAVAQALENAHSMVTNPKTYNNEYCFQSAIVLAYFYANTKYTIIKEMPTGKGYADIVLIPYKPNIPAIVIELKHNHSTESAIAQIKAKNYSQALSLYTGDLLLVGINYDEKDKKHTCKIERVVK